MVSWWQKLKRLFTASIKRKIIIPYAVLTIVLAVLGVYIVVNLVAASFEDRLKNQLRDAAQVVADNVVDREELRLEIQRLAANTEGVDEAVVNRDFPMLEELLFPVMANSEMVDSMIVVDTQSRELIRLNRSLNGGVDSFVDPMIDSGLVLSNWPVLEQLLDGQADTKVVQLAEDPETNELVIYTIGPLINQAGELVGAVMVGTYLQKEIATLQSLALAQLTLFDDQARILDTTLPLSERELATLFDFFTPEKYRQVVATAEKNIFLDQFFIPDEQDVNTILNVGPSGEGYRLAYAPFRLREEVFGVYAVALPTNFITETTDRSRNTIILIFMAGFVVFGSIGYVVSQRISGPILHLVKTSLAITGGDLNQRAGLNQPDEIGKLSNSFDEMTGKLQELLKAREEEASRLTAILNSIADGVVVQNLAGEILTINPAAEEILSMVEQRTLREVMDARPAEDEPVRQLDGSSRQLLSYLGTLEFKETRRFEAGNRMLSALSAPVVADNGEQIGNVVVLRDITREYESERLKDDFITSMSHELRTPLTAIKGYNQLLELTAVENLDERQMGFVKNVGSNVDDLLEIIQQMLDLSQIDAGNLGIDREAIEFVEMVESECDGWHDKMDERDMVFSTNFPDEEIWVEGDYERLTRVMQNLIKNAYNYTLPGGRILVKLAQTNGVVQIDIVDTGVGIALEDQRFLFTRFFRAIHEETTFEVSGAGLGLYTSKAIVEVHNGQMWMESELNKGSTFSFSLPIIDPDEWKDA